ncbi:L-2-amino-thiazoline-4-carboxylic acid hydrolase [Nocardia mexicana]|uniref:L-2-amino-thiazoline-4-carboxylic acid hydrolase-like protein n=1 Tax=Nocardia mexicana TaxID=279262 RepID=A0A370HEG8_9NOCA|nr:L-2-amino-thiazoline-4-carboxylic acid hydrolase [Nocardia mexicana]RDI55613.1 L-2-amino-thiazoline-4-carboxylic acid hydrolase-like protein [Nocardia mexicana]
MNTDQFGLSTGEYVPDPERDTALIVDGFFDSIAATARDHGIDGDPIASMRTALAESEAADADRIVDEPARHNLRMTLALVVAYRHLTPLIGRDAAIEAVHRAFVEPLNESLQAATRSMLDNAADPFAAMVEVSKTRENQAFGTGFGFERAADDADRYHLNVMRCFYYDVLAAHSATELAPVMCAFDGNWIEGIDPDRHGFRFDRSTTIGLGGTHCPFHFDRVPE